MIPTGFQRQRGRRCATVLTATVFCAVVCVANGGTVVLQQTPAQDRIGGGGGGGGWTGGGFFDHLSSLNPFASAPAAPSYNIPDVSGFGMYPLWKFHKFDGLSLRPVPYGVDIGSGLPPPPHPPSYPAGFLNAPNPPTRQLNNYGPPASPPPTNYEAAPPSAAPNYNPSASPNYSPSAAPNYSPPAAPSYSPPAQDYNPSLQPQILNYELTSQSYPPQAPPANNYGNSYNAPAAPSYTPNTGAQMSFAYQPVLGQRYNEPAGAYSAPATSYAEPQGYNSVPPTTSYGTPMGPASPGYDNMQYGASNGITIQFSAAPQQDYGMQQSQASYNPAPSGSFQMPTYSSIESPISVPYTQGESKPQQMDNNYGSGSFMKRSETAKSSEVLDDIAASDSFGAN